MLPEPDGHGHFVNVRPDIRYHIVTTGPHDAPLVIMLHGYPEFWWSWRYQLRFLDEHEYRAVAIDFRGVNHSDKPEHGYDPETLAGDIIALMDALGYEQAVIMGNDYGGVIAYVIGMLHPTRVKALVVLNALHPARWPTLKQNGRIGTQIFTLMARMGHRLGAPLLKSVNEIIGIGGAMKLLAHNKAALPHSIRHAYSEAYARYAATATAYVPEITEWFVKGVPADLSIPVPTLILWPQKDFTAPRWITRSVAKTLPTAQLVFVPDCGHWVQQEQPEFVNAAILEFLSGLD